MRKGIVAAASVPVGLLFLLLMLGATYERDLTFAAAGQYVQVDGLTLRTLQHGRGPDVLLIHGSMGGIEDWEAVMPLLAQRYRVTALDRPGHGFSSAAVERHTIATNAHVIRRLIETLGLKDVVIVGHSYGAAVALKLAVDELPQARGFVLVAPAAFAYRSAPAMNHAIATPLLGLGLARVLGPLVAPGMVEAGLRQALTPDEAAVPADFVPTRVALWTRPGVLHAYSQQLVAYNDEVTAMSAAYGTVRKPVVILQGTRDSIEPLIHGARHLAQTLPAATLRFEDSGHYLHYRQPRALIAAIDQLHGTRARDARRPRV